MIFSNISTVNPVFLPTNGTEVQFIHPLSFVGYSFPWRRRSFTVPGRAEADLDLDLMLSPAGSGLSRYKGSWPKGGLL